MKVLLLGINKDKHLLRKELRKLETKFAKIDEECLQLLKTTDQLESHVSNFAELKHEKSLL